MNISRERPRVFRPLVFFFVCWMLIHFYSIDTEKFPFITWRETVYHLIQWKSSFYLDSINSRSSRMRSKKTDNVLYIKYRLTAIDKSIKSPSNFFALTFSFSGDCLIQCYTKRFINGRLVSFCEMFEYTFEISSKSKLLQHLLFA